MNTEPHKHVRSAGENREFLSYVRGLVLALGLTLAAFALVYWHVFSRAVVLPAIAVLAIVQLVVHFHFFLHIGQSRQKREDLHLILFTTLLLVLMVGGTIWIMANLATRMAPLAGS